ncbi:hypothetical protein [Mycolicibacterium sp. P9-22]|uniref:hypothetical protein n=1 Tax=Mycolicibacterium sp. P9-22 TaxID=2024613 RepID=UPI0011F00E93|nr:hypothetical protein [Mycolicibacterium sp. P9-22]
MQRSIGLGVVAVVASAVLVVSPPTAPPADHDVTLTASTSVPPGGLISSFLRNQTVYCSIICPLLAQTGMTAVTTTLQAPGTFLAALSARDVLKAIGAAAASVTGPTEAAAQRAIDADAAIPAQRALNAFQVGVVGLLNVPPAAKDGPAGIAAALNRARQDTYDALNLPFVPDPEPTVMPRGIFQVAVVAAINVVAAVIFPGFNYILAGVFEVPDAMAQELARTGNPVHAVSAGLRTAGDVVGAAGQVITEAVVSAVDDVRQAASDSPSAPDAAAPNTVAPTLKAPKKPSSRAAVRTQPIPLRDVESTVRRSVHELVGRLTPRPSRNSPEAGPAETEERQSGDRDVPEARSAASDHSESSRGVKNPQDG